GFDLDCAFLEIRLFRAGICGVERDLVDELAGIEPRHEDHAGRHAVAPARLDARTDLAAPRDDADFRALVEAALARVVRIHEAARAGKGLEELGNAHGHG